MDFIQAAPVLTNQYRDDATLQRWLTATLPAPVLAAIDPELHEIGGHAATAWEAARGTPACAPVLEQWDAWGARVDRVHLTPVWHRQPALAARFGLVATGHDSRHGEFARVDQFARVYLHHVASAFFTCPLAMSDGAATALKASGNEVLCRRALPHLLARDPALLWTSGQWMTELAGGSDVGRSGTLARRDEQGRWRLHGRKWFTSAVASEMALTLARPEGAPPGSRALALFYLETRDADGHWNGIRVDRLKAKLGTCELPTAEIHLEGTLAQPVAGLEGGVRAIAPVLNLSRLWNAVGAVASMRRCLALACAHARVREAFGRPLIRQPLHRATLAGWLAEFTAAFHLAFHTAHLLGRVEHGAAGPGEAALLRVLVPLAKLWTARMAVRIASETCEAFGGAGYIENTGIPQLLRDAQVYPIWEGTTNVLALDVLRALDPVGPDQLGAEIAGLDPAGAGGIAAPALAAALDWHRRHAGDTEALQAGARGFALTLARCIAASLLARRCSDHPSIAAALDVFAARGLDRLGAADARNTALLLGEDPSGADAGTAHPAGP